MVEAAPATALIVPETDFLLQFLVVAFNGLIANDKFCLIRPLRLDLSWLRSRSRLKRPAPPNLPCEASPHGAEHAAAAHLAGPAHRRAGGDRSAALGPGLSASPSMGDDAATYASRGDAARDLAGDVSYAS